MSPSLSARKGLALVLAGFVVSCLTTAPGSVRAQDLPQVRVAVDPGEGSEARVDVHNGWSREALFIGVGLEERGAGGARLDWLSTPVQRQRLAPDARWQGTLRFQRPEGSGTEGLPAWQNVIVGAGVDVAEVAQAWGAALDRNDRDFALRHHRELRAMQMSVQRSVRRLGALVDALEEGERRWFDLETLVALRERLRQSECDAASARVLRARNDNARRELHRENVDRFGQMELDIRCLSEEAKLSVARALIRGERPDEAVAFSSRDEQGELLPEWRPIYVDARLGFVQRLLRENIQAPNLLRTALTALADIHQIAPEDARIRQAGAQIVPRVLAHLAQAIESRQRNDVLEWVELLRPAWADEPGVMEALHRAAALYVEEGLREARSGQTTTARALFVRGERAFEGVEAWESRRDEINLERARALLREGVEIAANERDPRAPARGMEKLEEARRTFALPGADEEAFLADIAHAEVAVSGYELEQTRFLANAFRRSCISSPGSNLP